MTEDNDVRQADRSVDRHAPAAMVDAGDQGYHKGLKRRHLQMIAIGGSIGTGLFLGAGNRMSAAGPSLAIVYLICGLFAFLVVRALGELAMHRPSSGAFVSYAREFLGEKGAYSVGWLYFADWSTSVVADITAIALYAHYWAIFTAVPQWVIALVALAVVMAMNLLSVKLFGELEYWFAFIKVGTIVAFGILGIILLVTRTHVGGHAPGVSLIADNGGMFPMGVGAMFAIGVGVVFAFGGTEMIGVAAGEAADARSVIPRAVNSIAWRIVLFYAGSVVLFTVLLPWTSYSGSESPFVTVLHDLGVPYAADVMNLVVLTAALSSLNAGLYATGRTLRSMAVAGTAPKLAKRVNSAGSPYGGILITTAVGVLGVILNIVVPAQAFEVVLNLAGLAIVGVWASIIVCHWIFVRRTKKGLLPRPAFRLPFAPYTNILTLAFLAAVVILMGVNPGVDRITLGAFVIVIAIMVAGWFAVRRRVRPDAATAALSLTVVPPAAEGDDEHR